MDHNDNHTMTDFSSRNTKYVAIEPRFAKNCRNTSRLLSKLDPLLLFVSEVMFRVVTQNGTFAAI